MNAADYDAWYDTARGRWIGEREFFLARKLLAAAPGAAVLDAGCGTGWFTRRLAADGLHMTGIDLDEAALEFARQQPSPGEPVCYQRGDLRALPFADGHFEHAVSIAALCFVDDERKAVADVLRVTRNRFVFGWLNRHSLLYRQKHGQGAYAGARWHTAGELRALFAGLPVRDLVIRSAVFMPSATAPARLAEMLIPAALPLGSMLLVAGRKDGAGASP